jgi:pyrroline-5-carboxylate reductase
MKLVVGSGRLASMLLTLLKEKKETYVYGRNEQTVVTLLKQFPGVKKGDQSIFSQVEIVFLCLPKSGYEEFLKEYATLFSKDVTFYHMATALHENDVKTWCAGRSVVPLKLAGHAAVVKKQLKGLFVIPPHYQEKQSIIAKWFPSMDIAIAEEDKVLLANQLGTEEAIRMILLLKERMAKHNLPESIIKQTFDQTVHGVIESYQNNDLGGFARKIANQLQQKGEKQSDENG